MSGYTEDQLVEQPAMYLMQHEIAWRTKRTTRAAVRVEIEKMLDSGLPEKYTTELRETKCGVLFQHVLDKYPDQGATIYSETG